MSGQDAAAVLGRALFVFSVPLTVALVGVRGIAHGLQWLPAIGLLFATLGGVFMLIGGDMHARTLKPFARRHGWEYDPRGLSLALAHPTAHPFGPTKMKRTHVLRGQVDGRPAQWFNLGTEYAVEMIRLPAALPRLELLPRSMRTSLDVGRGTDLRIEVGRFNDRWQVWCRDLPYAHALLAPDLVEMLENPLAEDMGIVIEGNVAYAWRRAENAKVEDIRGRLMVLTGVIQRIPAHVWRKYVGVEVAPMAADARNMRADAAAMTPVARVELARAREVARRASPMVTPDPLAEFKAVVAKHEVPRDRSFAQVAARDRNILGRMSVLLAFTWLGVPAGMVLAVKARRACRAGEANNPRVAMAGLLLNSLAIVLLLATVAAVIITDT